MSQFQPQGRVTFHVITDHHEHRGWQATLLFPGMLPLTQDEFASEDEATAWAQEQAKGILQAMSGPSRAATPALPRPHRALDALPILFAVVLGASVATLAAQLGDTPLAWIVTGGLWCLAAMLGLGALRQERSS